MDTLVNYGGEIKTLSDDGETLRIGGHLVLFGSPSETDATALRDYFTKSTDFDMPTGQKESTVYYHHGLNATLKARKLGTAKLSIDDAGVWMEAELKARDEYEKRVLDMVRTGKLGLSSGTAAHLVERKNVGSAHEIVHWPLGLDASLTPTPAEPRTLVSSLKSLLEAGEFGEESVVETESTTKSLEELEAHSQLEDQRFVDHSERVLAATEEFTNRATAVVQQRVSMKSGRRLSEKTKTLLKDHAASQRANADALEALISEDEPTPAEEAAKAVSEADVSAMLARYAATIERTNGALTEV